MLTDENYTPDELSAIASGYAKMLEESSGMLNEMKTVVTSTSLSMTDKERMDVIDRVYRDVRNQRTGQVLHEPEHRHLLPACKKRRTIPEGCWTCTERTIKNTGDMTGEETFSNLHEVLRNLYDEMMPLCSDITGVATGVAALGALFYVASRVWQALSRAEPIDIYPLFRPFCPGACIMFFPTFVLRELSTAS